MTNQALKPALQPAIENLPSDAVDELGALKAQISALQARETALKEILKATGEKAIDGSAYRASISVSERNGRDEVFKARIEELVEEHLSYQFISAHSTVSEVITIRVVSRKS